LGDHVLEAQQINIILFDMKEVAAAGQFESTERKLLAELGDVDLEGIGRRGGGIFAPERIDQAVRRDRPVGPKGQGSHQHPLAPAGERHVLIVLSEDLHWAE
jgi:hypothetical protein